MSVGEILGKVFEAYRGNFLLLMGISAAYGVPLAFVQTLARYVRPSGGNLAIVLGFLFGVLQPLAWAAIVFATRDYYLDRQSSFSSCYRRVFERTTLRAVIGCELVAFVLLQLPFAASAVLGDSTEKPMWWVVNLWCLVAAYCGLRLLLAIPVCVLERVGARQALSRSWSLMKGSMLRAAWMLVLLCVIFGVLSAVITWPTRGLAYARPGAAVSRSESVYVAYFGLTSVSCTLWVPIAALLGTVLYHEIRVRKEGLDLKILAKELEANYASGDTSTASSARGGASKNE